MFYMKEFVTIKVNEETLNAIKEHYSSYLLPNNGEYVAFYADYMGISITGYASNKEKKSVTFIGEGALNQALLFDENAKLTEIKEKEKVEWVNLENQIGSDEVGVGDFLLPLIVVSAFVRKKDIKALRAL